MEDMYLGIKLGLTPQEGILPEMAIIPQMTVPTGDSGFTAREVLPGLNWIYAWELSDRVSTGGSTQLNRSLDMTSGNAYAEWAQSWTVATAINDQLGVYTEWFAFFPSGADTMKVEHYLNGGFARLIGNNVQWDIRAGFGLNDSAADFFAGSGFSIRFQ